MTTAFVLSGGANLGAAQVGMLQALSEVEVAPDLVVGTSAGAINGAWLAAGEPLEELARIWRGLRRRDIFPASLVGGFLGFIGVRNHLLSPRPLRRLLERHTPFRRLEQAPTPFHVVVTDVLTGADIRLARGPTVEAIQASSAIPGVLPPVRIGKRAYMDGGVVNNAPISHAVELGADTVWVLAAGHSCALAEPPDSALGMVLHAVELSIHQRLALDIERYAGSVDLRVVPPLCPLDIGPTDFSRADELIRRAREHTARWLDAGVPQPPDAATLVWPHQHGGRQR